MAMAVARHRFTVAEYHRMGEAGILGEDERVELIDGEIVDMTPIGRRHQACVDRRNDLLVSSLRGRAIVRVQGSLRLDEHSEPQPDLVLLRYRPDYYATSDAGPADTLLVIEVAETSARYDRRVKVPLYARAGIPEVWLVDVDAGRVATYREPDPQGYRRVLTVRGQDRLAPLAFPDLALTAADVLG